VAGLEAPNAGAYTTINDITGLWMHDTVSPGTCSQILDHDFGTCTVGYDIKPSISSRGWQYAFACAANDWSDIRDSQRGNINILDLVDRTTNADVDEIRVFGGNLGGLSGSDITSGITYDYYGSYPATLYNGTFQRSEITINTNADMNWYVGCVQSGVGSKQADMVSSMGHELGHSLGLNHAIHGGGGGNNSQPIMSCVQPRGTYQNISADDKYGLRWLYSDENSFWGYPVSSPC
jgi:hypothetical protein